MATGETISAKVNYGLGKAGNILGFPYQWYRPIGGTAVVAPANWLGAVSAFITTSKALDPQPSEWGRADRYAAFDPTNFLAGDYLVGSETFFLAEIVQLADAVRLVVCNETFTWSQIADPLPGPAFRPGVKIPVPVAAAWLGWLAAGERRSQPDLRLPGEVEMPTALILLPASLPGAPVRGDQLTTADALPVTWTIQSAVLSANGWQIVAVRAGA